MTDSILVVGSGIAGLTAAMECAQAGARTIVVDNAAIVGGRLAAAMTDESSIGAGVAGSAIPKLSTLAESEHIEFMTMATLERIQGRPGNFDISVRQRARFVTDACTRCKRCRPVCPSVSSNEYDAGLTYRKAIFTPLPQTLPQEYVIDIDSCLNKPPNYLPCNRCIEVCDDDAIHFDLPLDQLHERQVGAVILSVGFAIADTDRLNEYGYGVHPDIVTAVELQYLLTEPGPTGGYVAKPSNEEYPESILLIVDELTPFSAYTAISQIHQLVEQDIDKIALLITDQQDEKTQSDFVQALPAGVTVNQGLLQSVVAGPDNKITVSYADFASHHMPKNDYDMVVLSCEICPAKGLDELAKTVELKLDEAGFVATPISDQPCATSRAGIYAVGGACGSAILSDTVASAKAAATLALGHLDPRLLKPGFVPISQVAKAPDTDTPSEDELRARIERALYTLMDR